MHGYHLYYSLLILSGAAGVAYQTIWTKMFAVALGHEIPSLFAVVTAFFFGLSAGAFTLHERIKLSQRPESWYAMLELCIAVWVLILLLLQPFLSDIVSAMLSIEAPQSQHWLTAFLFSTLLLFPATFAMGASLPAMEQAIARHAGNTPVVGSAYAMNTLGAVVGVLLGTFWLMPKFGQSISLVIFMGINLFCAIATLVLTKFLSGDAGAISCPANSGTSHRNKSGSLPSCNNDYLMAVLFFTGLFGIAYEILCVRIMSQVFEGTLYSFATALSVYLIASTIGAIIYHRRAGQMTLNVWLPRLLTLLAYSCLLGLVMLYYAEPLYRFLRITLGDTAVAVFISEMGLALAVFFVPSLLMGATFGLLAQAHRDKQQGLGQALAINTLGGALAPSFYGLILLPLVGAKWALGSLVIGYLLLVQTSRDKVLQILAIAMGIYLTPALQIVTLRDNERLLDYREGVTATSAVVEKASHRNLRINNRYQMGGTSIEAQLFQRRQAHIPLLLHPAPKHSLFLGVASGVTMGAATGYKNLQIDAVELVPEALELLEYFSPANRAPHKNPRVQLYAADARRFVRTKDKQYDVIIADLFHPSRDGAGLLFTQEHYQAIKMRLAAGGIFCHWLPFHQLNEEMIAVITQTFLSVFPNAKLVLSSNNINYPTLGLVTGIDTKQLKAGYLQNRVNDRNLQRRLARALLRTDFDLFSSLLLDNISLQQIAGNAPINHDTFPIISYQSPLCTYQRTSQSYGRFMRLLDQYEIHIGQEIIGNNHDSVFSRRLQAYIRARNQYLYALRTHIEKGKDNAIESYFTSAKTSNDFNSSYSQLYQIALNYMEDASERQKALEIVEELYRVRPLPKVEETLTQLREMTR